MKQRKRQIEKTFWETQRPPTNSWNRNTYWQCWKSFKKKSQTNVKSDQLSPHNKHTKNAQKQANMHITLQQKKCKKMFIIKT